MAIVFDTLAYARRLREAGVSEQQAEAHAEALASAMTESLATKQDLRELELRLDARFARIEDRFGQVDARFGVLHLKLDEREKRQDARFDARLADLERRMTVRLGGIMVAGVGFLSALVTMF